MFPFGTILPILIFKVFDTGADDSVGIKCREKTDTVNQVCVSCYFPQNCMENNTCALGTRGPTCEFCARPDYYRLGNMCTECLPVPWAAVMISGYLLLLVVVSLVNGFTASVCTKLKILVNMLQFLFLTSLTKIQWPVSLQELIAFISFSLFNADVMSMECIIPSVSVKNVYFSRWLSSTFLPTFVLLAWFPLDKMLKIKAENGRNETKYLNIKSMLRRFVFFVAVCYYMPVSYAAVQSLSCSSVISQDLTFNKSPKADVFLHHQTIQCEGFVFESIQCVTTLYLIVCTILFPLLLTFFTLRQRKWSLLKTEVMKYGFAYESYKDRYCFWDAIGMLRKIVYIFLTESYVVGLGVQIIVQTSLTVAYIIALVLLRPYTLCSYGKSKTSIHLVLDVLTNLPVVFLQGVAFLLFSHYYQDYQSFILITVVVIVLVVSVALLLLIPLENRNISTIENADRAEPLALSSTSVDNKKERNWFGRKNKVGVTKKSCPEEKERIGKAIGF